MLYNEQFPLKFISMYQTILIVGPSVTPDTRSITILTPNGKPTLVQGECRLAKPHYDRVT